MSLEFQKAVTQFLVSPNGKKNATRFKLRLVEKNLGTSVADYVRASTPETCKDAERLWMILCGHTALPVCPTCGISHFSQNGETEGGTYAFRIYCSTACWKADSEGQSRRVAMGKKGQDPTEGNAKRAKTLKAKYGVEYHSQRPEVKAILGKKLRGRFLTDEQIRLLDDRQWLEMQHIKLNKPVTLIAKEIGVNYETVQTAIIRQGLTYTSHMR